MPSSVGRALALAALVSVGGHFCQAQQVPVQFGDVKAADFAPQPKTDTTAAAEILRDLGQSKIKGSDEVTAHYHTAAKCVARRQPPLAARSRIVST